MSGTATLTQTFTEVQMIHLGSAGTSTITTTGTATIYAPGTSTVTNTQTVTATTTSTVTTTVTSTIPSIAAAAGYNTKTFSTTNFGTSNVDMSDTFASGFQWYKWNFFSENPANASVTLPGDGSVMVAGAVDSYGNDLTTVGYISSAPGYVGTAFGGGAYIEAVLKFPATTQFNGSASGEWPAFWCDAIESMISGATDYIEADIMEYFSNSFGNPLNQYSATTHNWGIPSGSQTNQGFNETVSQANLSNYNTYAMLWIPATSTTNGSVTYYFNGAVIGSTSYAQGATYSIIDSDHLILKMVGNPSCPMTVESVNVWQASGASNLHN